MDFKPKIIVTGFGPFSHHHINDSAVCANKIKESGLEDELNVDIITAVIDVDYDKALERVIDLWSCHNPFVSMRFLSICDLLGCILINDS